MQTATAAPEPNDERENMDDKKEVISFKPSPAAPKFFSLVPKDLGEALKLAEMMAASDLVPKDYKGKPGNCLIGMQFGAELGLPPMQAVQNIAVINGKPGLYGDIGKGLLLGRGFKIEERDTAETKAKSAAWCRITRPDGQVTERTFTIDDAKTAGLWGKQGPWTTNPHRQMAWRAFWFAARDIASDVLKGLGGVEELQDYKMNAVETSAFEAPTRLSETKAAPEETKEPTPETPVVDEPVIDAIQRKMLVDEVTKAKCMEELKIHLRDTYGIKDEKTPTAHIPRKFFAEIVTWVQNPNRNQEDIPFGD